MPIRNIQINPEDVVIQLVSCAVGNLKIHLKNKERKIIKVQKQTILLPTKLSHRKCIGNIALSSLIETKNQVWSNQSAKWIQI